MKCRRRFAAALPACILATVLLLPAPVTATTADEPFTLEQVLSAPFPSDLVAATAADRIAWVETERGARSLWTAAAPGFEPQELVRYGEDDGQALSDLALTTDGSLLLYVRGGAPNRAGEVPNPASDPEGAERAIWAVSTAGGEPWKVAMGSGPVPAPAGDAVVFAQGSEVFRVALRPPENAAGEDQATAAAPVAADKEADDATSTADRRAGEDAAASRRRNGDATEGTAADADGPEGSTPAAESPETLFTARGALGALTFSPDGSRLAFVSDRGDHAFVGVFELEARVITWMAPGVDRDGFPAFSPDGSRLAFLRVPGARMAELFDLTSGWPFAVWVGDPATGEAKELWHSPGPDGGYAQFYPDRPLVWAGDQRLLFTSEHGGWLHLFALPATGGTAVDLTPGEGEIESFEVSGDGRFAYLWSNHGDLHRRQLFRVATAGGEPGDGGAMERLSPPHLLAFDPRPLPGGAVAFRGSDARRPPAVRLLGGGAGGGGGSLRTVAPRQPPAGFPAEALVEPQVVSFPAGDGQQVHGQLFLPPGAAAGDRRPGVIFLHGGPIRQMLPGWHNRGYYANAYAFNQYLASRGYLVLALNYRCGIGYGRAFRQAPEQGPRGAAEYRDLVAAGRWLRARPEVDPRRIGLWGGSYGGYLTALGLARDSDLFAAGVDLHGVHDWAWRGEHFAPGGGWGLSADDLALARRSSPVADLSLWTSPVLLVHGDDDRNVDFIQTTDLVQRLRDRGVPVELLVFPDEVHGFLRHASWLATYGAAADFFDRHLGPERR